MTDNFNTDEIPDGGMGNTEPVWGTDPKWRPWEVFVLMGGVIALAYLGWIWFTVSG